MSRIACKHACMSMVSVVLVWPAASVQSERLTEESRTRALLARLAAERVETRKSAARALSALGPGPWLETALGMSASLKPDARRELDEVLGSKPALLEPLARALLDEPKKARAAARALRRHLLLHIPPSPRNPDRDVFPRVPLDLRNVRNLLDLCDRLLVSGWFTLPFLIHPGLDQKGSWARSAVQGPPGAPLLRELLPPFGGPGGPQWDRPITRVWAEGFLLTGGQSGGSFADAFPENLRVLLAGSKKASIADRAAINLGCLDLVSMRPFLQRLAESGDALGDRASLALAVTFLRGFDAPDGFAVRLMPVYRASASPPREESSSRRLLVGTALRRLVQRESSPLPSWLGKERPWQEDAVAELFAGIAPGALSAEFSRALLEEDPSARVRASLMLSLSRAPGMLCTELRRAVRDRVLEDPWPDDDEGNRVLEAALRLLEARGGTWLPAEQQKLGDGSLGTSHERGTVWARALGRAGAEGRRIALGTLLQADALHPSHVGLLAFAREGALGGMRKWLEIRGLAGTEHGRTLLDLLIGSIGPLRLRTEQERRAALACFGRLHALLARAKHAWMFDAIGAALGRLLLALPQGPDNRSAAAWIVSWLLDPNTRRGGLAAARTCLADRESLLGDIDGELGKLKRLDRTRAVRLSTELRPLANARPASLGWAPVDPMDPLLHLRPGEKR